MGKSTISMAIFNIFCMFTRGQLRKKKKNMKQLRMIPQKAQANYPSPRQIRSCFTGDGLQIGFENEKTPGLFTRSLSIFCSQSLSVVGSFYALSGLDTQGLMSVFLTQPWKKAHLQMVYLLKMVIFHGKLLVITRWYPLQNPFAPGNFKRSADERVGTRNDISDVWRNC